ncbi:MAG: flavin reductase [Methylococcaceae bacterium]|nr:flavin reductase [Methylococcaceae bacterium]
MIEHPERMLQFISHGVYVIGVSDGAHQNAFTAAWVMQVSFDPMLLAFSINPEHYSYQLLLAGGICSVNVLGQDHYSLAEHFGRSGLSNKMAGFEWRYGKSGAPVLLNSLAYFDCEVSHYAEAGDHKIAVCKIIDAAQLNAGLPLLYSQTGGMDGSSEIYKK